MPLASWCRLRSPAAEGFGVWLFGVEVENPLRELTCSTGQPKIHKAGGPHYT